MKKFKGIGLLLIAYRFRSRYCQNLYFLFFLALTYEAQLLNRTYCGRL
jgi:hypothetical protein